jgi:hypothetical protein
LAHRLHEATDVKRIVMVVLGGLISAACISPLPETESRVQDLGSGSDPGDPPPVCDDTPGCSLTYQGGYASSLQQQLRCGQDYYYLDGASGGFMGGIGSYCPDSSAVRTALASHHIHFVDSTYCATCLSVPLGKLFVFWNEFWGPGCPSSCVNLPAPY